MKSNPFSDDNLNYHVDNNRLTYLTENDDSISQFNLGNKSIY
jgi:hypothetical protein